MIYFVVRISVYLLALTLTLWLLPGIHVDFARIIEVPIDELATELAAQPNITPSVAQAVLVFIQYGIPFLFFLGLAFVFWFWNWLLWPVVLFFTGRLVVWSFGLLLIAGNAFLFYITVINEGRAGISTDDPEILWCVLGGM